MFNWVDCMIDSLDGQISENRLNYEDFIAVTREKLLILAKDKKRILISGTASEKAFTEFCKRFFDQCNEFVEVVEFTSNPSCIEVCCSPNLNNSSVSLRSAKLCDAVVLLEEKKYSRFMEIDQSIVTLQNMEKPLLGFIVL